MKRRFLAFLALLPVLLAGLWFGFGREQWMIHDARKVQTSEDAMKFMRKCGLRDVGSSWGFGDSFKFGVQETDFSPFGFSVYERQHGFSWSFDSAGKMERHERWKLVRLFRREFWDGKTAAFEPPLSHRGARHVQRTAGGDINDANSPGRIEVDASEPTASWPPERGP
jgi:hypothetical protein